MRKLTKIILPEVGVGDLKIRPRGDNRCESANFYCSASLLSDLQSCILHFPRSRTQPRAASPRMLRAAIFLMYKESTFVQLDMLCIENRDA